MEEKDLANPRLAAIQDLLKYLNKSEADRFKKADVQEEKHEPSGQDSPSEDELEALRSLVG